MSESTYSVYLIERQGSQGGERQVTSPIEGTELDFYDSGVWLTRETGRNFFPYEQIRTIREHPAGGDRETESESAAESDEIEGESTETDPEEDPGIEGDSGAEEDMLEE